MIFSIVFYYANAGFSAKLILWFQPDLR